jgi:hypothetical protein
MMLCLNCGTQRPNKYKSETCPQCNSYLKYVEAPAKATVIKLHKAGLSVSYATAEVYSYGGYAVHTTNISIGLAQPYQSVVFRRLPKGLGYIIPHSYEYMDHIPKGNLLYPVRTYGMIRYEIPYLDHTEARAVLRQKLKELESWVDEATADGWLAICNLGGLL